MAREAEGDVVLITGKDDTSQFHFCFPPMFYIKNAHEKSRESEDFFFFLVCFTRMENQFFLSPEIGFLTLIFRTVIASLASSEFSPLQ